MNTLLFVSFLCFFFMIAEFIGGVYSQSLAVITDSAHQLSDVAGFVVSYLAIRTGKKATTF